MNRTISTLVLSLAVLVASGDLSLGQLLGHPEEFARVGAVLSSADFDGDGFADLAVTAEGVIEDDRANNLVSTGQVHVIYGTVVGLTPARQQLWNLTTLGVHPFDRGNLVGHALATGDFDADGYFDLAISAPYFQTTPNGFAGAVYVIYGTPEGLTNARLQSWYPNREDLDIVPTGNDEFGGGMVSGDFTGDGFDDLAIGIPNFEIGEFKTAGNMLVLRGSANGLTSAGHQVIPQPPHPDNNSDQWGEILAAGDINGDGFDELAVGLPKKRRGQDLAVGGVGVLYGTRNGITTLGYDFIRSDGPGILGAAERSDWFGNDVAIADFGSDGFGEIVIGAPREEAGGPNSDDTGAFLFMFGSASGVSRDNAAYWTVAGVPLMGGSDNSDIFGTSLETGDFDGDGDTDLVVGQPGNKPGGGFNLILSQGTSISVVGNTFWARGQEGVPVEPTSFSRFGEIFAAGDFNGDGRDDLAVGVARDDYNGKEQAGSVTVFYGAVPGLTTDGAQVFRQNLAPSASQIIAPADGETLFVGGTEDPVDPATQVVVIWSPAEDPENLPVAYWWQISSNAEFSDTLATIGAGTLNQFAVPLSTLAGLMDDAGVALDESVTWYHRIIAFDGVDYVTGEAVSVVMTRGTFVGSEENELPGAAGILANYPNPFSTSTTIVFRTNTPGPVRLDLYDVRGSLVTSTTTQKVESGLESLEIDRANLPAGVYLYTLRGGGVSDSGRLVVID